MVHKKYIFNCFTFVLNLLFVIGGTISGGQRLLVLVIILHIVIVLVHLLNLLLLVLHLLDSYLCLSLAATYI